MKLVCNTGTDRVIDLVRPWLAPGNQLDMVTPSLSLFAFGEIRSEVDSLAQARLLLPADGVELGVLGTGADRSGRNRLQNRWLSKCLAKWLYDKVEVRRAQGAVPQGAVVQRAGDGRPQHVVLGSLAFSTDGLGLTPGNPLNLIQASETAAEAALLSQWFDAQWSALPADTSAKPSSTPWPTATTSTTAACR